MKKFRKWKDTGLNSMISTDERSTRGTPLGKKGGDFYEFMSDVDGFEPGANAYVYTIVLKRQADDTHWYYVGETTDGVDGLKTRFEIHLRCGMSKPVRRGDVEVIDGALSDEVDHSYAMIGVERAEPVSVDDDHLLEARAAEREREMAYEIALEKDTTRVLGGA